LQVAAEGPIQTKTTEHIIIVICMQIGYTGTEMYITRNLYLAQLVFSTHAMPI
jgi:hypothetical protein